MRLRHIDRIRAIAILCMIQVHTASIIPPEGISISHPLAFVSAAIGGMAAPLFVTISGWGMYSSAKRRSESENSDFSSWMRWILPRFVILILCQLVVNSALLLERGGRFEWMTPGVLTLLALASLLGPVLIFLKKEQRVLLMLLLICSPLLLGDMGGGFNWVERIYSEGFGEWVQRLLLNGTYPALPWLAFVVLGSLVEDYRDHSIIRRLVAFGLVIVGISITFSIYRDIPWALTSGDAILTFFPANSPFVFTSIIFVIILFKLLEGNEMSGGEPATGRGLSWLEPAGRLSLTIYVMHFVVLGIIAFEMQNQPRLGTYVAFLLTIVHTAIWIPLAILHEKYIPQISFEKLLKRFN